MLHKILASLTRIGRNYLYTIIGSLVAIAIIVTNVHPLQSETVLLPSREVVAQSEPLLDLKQFSGMIAKLEKKWEGDYERYFSRDFAHNSDRTVNKVASRLREIKEKAKINPAVIWAVPQDDFLQLMLVTPDGQFVRKKVKAAPRARLTQRIKELQIGIADRQSLKYLPPARLIYSWLFKPLDPYLEAEEIDTLLLCTGPTLRSLPFSSLHDGEKFVVEKYNLARIPAFSLTDTSYESKPKEQVLALGASEFNDLPSLPGVEVEVNTIVPKLWSGQKMLNQDFTVSNLKQAHQLGDFDIVHIASHAKFDTGEPEKSYIQFGDRKLRLDQLENLDLDSPQVDLLVLSACETALGDKDAEFGFAGLAMQAGVKSVLASLWTINDAGTIVLMSEFYQQLRSTPIKSAALRQAQINMLQEKVYVKGTQVIGSKAITDLPADTSETEAENFHHPFYWAGFTIIGNPW